MRVPRSCRLHPGLGGRSARGHQARSDRDPIPRRVAGADQDPVAGHASRLRGLCARGDQRSRERHGQRALPGLRRPRRLADGHLDPKHRRGPAGSAYRVRPEPRRGSHLEPAADHCRAGEGGRGAHGELGLSAGEPIGTDLRAVQPERGQVRHLPAHDRAAGRHLQRRQRPDLVGAADRAAAAQHPRQPGPELPAAIGSAGRSRSGWSRTAATWPA